MGLAKAGDAALSGLRSFGRPRSFGRTPEQIREHYVIEREIADRLRSAPAAERRALYASLYDELMRRVPHHPMQRQTREEQEEEKVRRLRAVERQLRFLARFLPGRSVFMEIGAGDCLVSIGAASEASYVYAIDVSEEIVGSVEAAPNMQIVLSDGVSIPVPEGSIDVAFSDQLMEHLHPEDAREQLQNIFRALADDGAYVCVTPSRIYGPTDISAWFDDRATGMHLKEYSAREIRTLLRSVGFRRLRFYAGARGWYMPVPFVVVAAAEALLDPLPYRLRRFLADTAPLRALLGLRVCAFKDAKP